MDDIGFVGVNFFYSGNGYGFYVGISLRSGNRGGAAFYFFSKIFFGREYRIYPVSRGV